MNPAPGRIGLHADPPVAVTAGQARPLLVPWTLKNGSGSTLRFYHAGVAQQTLALLDHVVRYVLLQLACHACNRSHAGCDDSRPCKVRLVEKKGVVRLHYRQAIVPHFLRVVVHQWSHSSLCIRHMFLGATFARLAELRSARPRVHREQRPEEKRTEAQATYLPCDQYRRPQHSAIRFDNNPNWNL